MGTIYGHYFIDRIAAVKSAPNLSNIIKIMGNIEMLQQLNQK